MRALVTGASGFTGSHLARSLHREGYAVRALLRSTSRRDLFADVPVEVFEGDLLDSDNLRRAVAGIDRVFHVAAVYREARLSDRTYHRVNVEATRILAEAALEEGCERFLYCSTCGVHGDVENPPADETAPYRPGDIYQRTKVEAEKIVAALHRERGLPAVILRPVGIYGPGDRRFLKLFRGIARQRFPMIGSGEALYHLTHVEDVARGFLLAAEAPAALGESFILAGARYTTVRELVGIIAAVSGARPPRLRLPAAPLYAAAVACEALLRPLGIEPPLYPRRLDFFLKDRAFRIEKARRMLGWEPRIELEEGIRQTLAWYRERGWV